MRLAAPGTATGETRRRAEARSQPRPLRGDEHGNGAGQQEGVDPSHALRFYRPRERFISSTSPEPDDVSLVTRRTLSGLKRPTFMPIEPQ